MKRIISLLMSILMILSVMVNCTVTIFAAPAHSPRPKECSHSNIGVWYEEPYYKEYDELKHYKYEVRIEYCKDCDKTLDKATEVWKKDHSFRSGECIYCGYGTQECEHSKTKNAKVDSWYEKYSDTKHWYIEEYETICKSCDEVIDEYTEKSKEAHDFSNGKCKDCGYEIENCSHSKTEKKISYWDLDLEYYEYDIICTICNTKIRTEASWGDDEEEESHNCSQNAKTEERHSYYEKNNSETHYYCTYYETSCTKCEESIETYTTKIEERHTLSNNICTKCGYEKKTTSNNSGTNAPTTSQKPADNTSGTNKETIEWIYIDCESSKFTVDEKVYTWKAQPIIDPNGNMQVPLRQLAELMGWKVSWDANKNHAIVTDGKTTKTFMQGFDVYEVKTAESKYYVALQNKVQNINGTLYVDLDGVLDCTGYSFYVHRAQYYHIMPRSEVISQVATSTVLGNFDIVGSKTVLKDPQFELEVHQNEMLFMIIENDDGTRSFAAFIPAAEQALKGNYYEGEITWQGVVGEIIVGELPGVGTVADFRDIAADFQNWEWSWAHAGQTAIDMIGIIPFVGCLKYTDEVGTLLKKSGKVADVNVTKTAQKFMDQAAHYDELAEATSKTLADYLKAAKAAIKNVGDLEALAKHPDIYADDVIEHIFYGNKKGGFHYAGLSGSNGKITKITSKPNKYGVYEAEVTVLGKPKKLPNTFFPDTWTPQQVLDTIDEAYYNGVHNIKKNIIEYTTKSGMEIQVNLNDSGKIVSAYPKY